MPTIAYLTAGGAGMFCGSCMRDNTLAAALTRLGCDVQLIPLYTPIRTDEEDVSIDQVFFGGINVYLQQNVPLFRYLPGFLVRWLDHPRLINGVSRFAIRTSGRQLGRLALSVLRGEHGNQRGEVVRLVDWLGRHVKPQLVNLSNLLIAGCVPAIKRELKVPVLVTLQGDDLFLEELPEPFQSRARDELRRLAAEVDGFMVFSRYYAEYMADQLQVPLERFHIVPLGIQTTDYQALDRVRAAGHPPTIGYLARLCQAKGLHVLAEAYLRLRTLPGTEQARLEVAGWLPPTDREFVEAEFAKLRAAGAGDDFRYWGAIEREQKLDFLRTIDVLSVPTTYRDPKGIFVLEALASGVPVVQPAHGAFPELLAATGGGVLVPPNDPEILAHTLHDLLVDHAARLELGRQGRDRVLGDFNADRMAAATLDVYQQYLAAPLASAHFSNSAMLLKSSFSER
ncbi:MAG: hexosyltransferase [Planctomycetia bacterium 21-64-5]|nr:MAG: hexosyltransferase [Planctomycetia bacterium 21-64-5]HQU42647.1 glycosyltransferase family 4 protein [Pirellulales bacterium]